MGGSNPNDSISATHFDPNQGIGSGINVATIDKPWIVDSAHPELVSEGLTKGIGSLAKGAIGGISSASRPNATGGYNTEAAAKAAAPYASSISNVQGIGWVPRAQGFNN